MYRVLISFVMNKDVYDELDGRKGEILPENFASADVISDLLEAGYIEEYKEGGGSGEISKYAPQYISFSIEGNSNPITNLDYEVANLDTSKIKNMSYMFYQCVNLTSLNLTNFDVSSVENFEAMFAMCSKLKSLNLSNWVISNATNMNYMFQECEELENLDIRTMDFTNVTNSSNIFRDIPNDCEVIVKDETAKAWVLNKNSNLTNVKTVAEL